MAGRGFTRGLFKEYAEEYAGQCEQIYSIEEFHKVFLEELDLTEYRPAMKLVGSWTEWLRLKRDWVRFKEMVDDWKIEAKLKLHSDAFAKLQEVMLRDDATAAVAAKFILSEGYDKKAASRAKRVKSAVAETQAETKEDWARIAKALEECSPKEMN